MKFHSNEASEELRWIEGVKIPICSGMCMPHNYCTFTVNTKICISWALCIHILLHSGKTQVSLCLVLCQSGNSKFGNSYSVKFTINTTTVKPLRYCTFCSFYSRGLWCWIAVQLIMSSVMLITWLQSRQKKEKRT